MYSETLKAKWLADQCRWGSVYCHIVTFPRPCHCFSSLPCSWCSRQPSVLWNAVTKQHDVTCPSPLTHNGLAPGKFESHVTQNVRRRSRICLGSPALKTVAAVASSLELDSTAAKQHHEQEDTQVESYLYNKSRRQWQI